MSRKVKREKKSCRKVGFDTAKDAYAVRDEHPVAYDGCKVYKCPYCSAKERRNVFHLGHFEAF